MIGIFGGSFDPIHNGHLDMARLALQQFSLEKILFVPCKLHAFHKQFHVSDIHRVAMLELALADEPQMFIDTRELKNDQISYTINTLRSLQQDYPEEQLALILGWDAFSKFDQWHEWQAFLQMSSLIILPRDTQNATPLNPTLSALLKQHQTTQHKIYLAKMPMVDISSTQLREKLAEHQDITAELPPAIAQYIKQHHLYQMEFNLLDTHRSRLADVD